MRGISGEMKEKQKKSGRYTPLAVLIITPILIFMICTALTIVLGIKPYNKLTTYINIAFSDNMKMTTPASDLLKEMNDEVKEYTKDPQASVSQTGEVIFPTFGEQYATLKCEAIDLYVPVYWGSDNELLKKGACQMSSSAVVGEVGNAVIDAHVNTFFENLNKLKEGDTVVINTNYGEFTYEVKKQVEFVKTDKTYVAPAKEEKLTLYTCVKQVLGSSDKRIAVICEPVEKAFYN